MRIVLTSVTLKVHDARFKRTPPCTSRVHTPIEHCTCTARALSSSSLSKTAFVDNPIGDFRWVDNGRWERALQYLYVAAPAAVTSALVAWGARQGSKLRNGLSVATRAKEEDSFSPEEERLRNVLSRPAPEKSRLSLSYSDVRSRLPVSRAPLTKTKAINKALNAAQKLLRTKSVYPEKDLAEFVINEVVNSPPKKKQKVPAPGRKQFPPGFDLFGGGKKIPRKGTNLLEKGDKKPAQQSAPAQRRMPQRKVKVARKQRKVKIGGNFRKVNAPAAAGVTNRKAGSDARMIDGGKGAILTNREYVQDIRQTTSNTLEIDTIQISDISFARAKQMAGLFENYAFLALSFEYISNTASTTTGTIILAPDYDPSDTHVAADGKADLLAMDDAVSGNPWLSLKCVCSAANLRKRNELFTGTVPAGTTAAPEVLGRAALLRQHYLGTLAVGHNANLNTSIIGELWVSYTIRFWTPQIVPIKSSESDPYADSARCTGTSNAAPFGTTYAEGGLPATFSSSGTTTSVTTWTFTQGWSGYCTINLSTAAGISSITPSGTGDEAEIWEDSSSLSWFGWIDCDPGETFILTIGNTDISGCTAYFVRGADRRP